MLELVARFDFPVDGASIEGYTDNTALFESSVLLVAQSDVEYVAIICIVG